MERNVDIDKISDGKRYGANDMVKVGCDDCRGCSACCRGMGDSIVLDPMDLYRLERNRQNDGGDSDGGIYFTPRSGRCDSAASENDGAVRPVQFLK